MHDAILSLLRSNEGTYVSGENISHMLNVSRTAVWKHIQRLRNAGYIIEANHRQGYRLTGIPDLLLPSEILNGLQTKLFGRMVHHFTTIESTNQEAKRLAVEGGTEGTIVVAETQSCGRGRLSRHWFSAKTGGIWFSLILRPRAYPANAAKFTFLGAVVVTDAIRKLTGLSAEIKWPNDILYQGRKLVGILTELNAEVDEINFMVMGIGINVNMELADFPADIQKIATSLKQETGQEISRLVLLRNILQQFEALYDRIAVEGFDFIFDAWRNMNCTLGHKVCVSSANQQFVGQALDIDDEGALLIEKQDGTIERVIAGDVSVRHSLK